MRLRMAFDTISILLVLQATQGFSPLATSPPNNPALRLQATSDSSLTLDIISKLRFRELQSELESRALPISGTTSQLKSRLRQAVGIEEECKIEDDEDCVPQLETVLVNFVDASDPKYEAKELIQEIQSKSAKGHWKAATRKLKRLTRRHQTDTPVPAETYLAVLEACMADRLHGARASEPARKILEQMVEQGYRIPEQAGNYCIKNTLGDTGRDSTHQGFGGLDTALAMLAALRQSETPISLDTYDKLCIALAKDGSIVHSLELLKEVVVDQTETPPLSTFAEMAKNFNSHEDEIRKEGEETPMMKLLGFAKAAGYDLDTIASTEDGRQLLANGVVAAERAGNVALGLRLLTAASRAKGVQGDLMVTETSPATQRASVLIHKRAIIQAVEDREWKLAVRLLELMLSRNLKTSAWLWRNVVTCCAKAEKSKKATALLLDWVKLYEQGKADKPPLSVFNTVMNVCEICNEQDLTLVVLDAMKKTHDTDGNLITFNIALKRLAKQGNFHACEGIIVGMLQANIEPSVVSYTTAIAACVSHSKQANTAYEWIRRMRSRRVPPNVITYNTALAACIDDTLESTVLASRIASEMKADAVKQAQQVETGTDEYTDVLPDSTTKMLVRQLLEQLDRKCQAGEMDARVAEQSIRIPLVELVDFTVPSLKRVIRKEDDDQALATAGDELELEYSTVSSTHRTAEV